MSFTLATLKSAIQDYTQNDETNFVSNLNMFIRLAEEKIFKAVQLNYFRKNASGAMTSGNRFLACPSDFIAPYSLSITNSGNIEFLLFKDLNFVQTYTPNSATTGVPKYFAQFDVDNFIIAPTPNANFTTTLSYSYRPASLTAGADSGTTWISENAEVALLYGSLLEAYTYMKGEADILNLYNSKFSEALIGVKKLGESNEVSDNYRGGQIIREKT
jgi:hypothetical protein|tara:strand:+ start:1045 stop:1692 length:648 start_codon:yes stop_codon:yes gene_type:complete